MRTTPRSPRKSNKRRESSRVKMEEPEDQSALEKPTCKIDENAREAKLSSDIEMLSPAHKRVKTVSEPQAQMRVGVAKAESEAIVYGYLTNGDNPALLFRIDAARVKQNSHTDFGKTCTTSKLSSSRSS
jgi:hypothetical protein